VSGINEKVYVRRQWNDWRIAGYFLTDVSGLHWDSISGGIMAASPRPFLSGYVLCTEMVEGELAHSCEHGPPPHKIKVCITKKDNTKEVYEKLSALADQPAR